MAKIVVVDDRVTNRNILTRLAMSVGEGHQVTDYGSGQDVLAALDGGLLPDLVITDFNMPGMDGASLVRALRNRPALADVPIIVVTIYEDREYCYQALEAGATDFLLSPVDHLEFRARARNLLTLRRQQELLAKRAADLARTLDERGPTGTTFETVLDAFPAAISITDAQGRLIWANRLHGVLAGVDRSRALGERMVDTHGDDYALKHGLLDEKVRETGEALGRPQYITASIGATRRCLLTAKAPMPDGYGGAEQVVTVALDVTDLRRAENREASAARMDPMTGLPNEAAIREHLEGGLRRAPLTETLMAVHHVDLDRFKGMNDAFGAEFGDALLVSVAARLQGRLGEDIQLGRLGSDEFIVVQSGIKRAEEASDLCRRLADTFAAPFMIRGREVHLSASMGVTLAPADGRGADTVLRNAELAMYRAKASGRDTFRFFSTEMDQEARRAVALERELRQALAADQFVVYYQPQLDLVSGDFVGVEALIRWRHPRRGLIRPGEFIGFAEEIGLITPITAWVLRSACNQHRQWRDRGLDHLQLSVNLSPVQFRERGVEWMIERALTESGLPASCLDIELTENAVIENSETAALSLQHLHQLGVQLSIDDFGTGYSSLSYIKRLPVQRLKIDQSFVRGLETSVNDEVIVRAIINLGHSLGLRVIAEGVETQGQLVRLRELGCDEVQGHLISAPVDAASLDRLFGLSHDRVAAAAGG